ncbi:MDR family MFS transporter [Pradoshia sp.]|uniref:MDR family MFS transporter n=1 Tax=Pradoshia sp. TaxID=2651281 RepID=UPI003EFFBAF6
MNFKTLPQNIKVRLITSFFNRAASSAVMPFMALYFAQELNKIWAGLFLIFTVMITFAANLMGGYISDRFKRKKVLLITSSLSTLMFLGMTVSLMPKDDWVILFAAAYIGFLITSSLGRPCMQAIIMDSTTPENRRAVYAIDYWQVNLSMAIGAAMGGLFYLHYQKELFMVLSFISFMIVIAYHFWLIDNHTHVQSKSGKNLFLDIIDNYQVALADRQYVKLVLGFTLILSAEFSLNSYIGVRLAENFNPVNIFGFTAQGVHMLSMLNILNMVSVVLLTFFVTKMASRFSNKSVLITGLIIYGTGYAVITAADTWYVLLLFGFVATIGELLYSPVYTTEQANMIPADKRGSYSAFAGAAYNGAELMARFSIILGAYLIPSMMSVYVGLIVTAGTLLLYLALYSKKAFVKETGAVKTNY